MAEEQPLHTIEALPYKPQWSPWVRQFVTVGLVIAGVYALTVIAPVGRILITTFLLAFLIFVPAQFLAKHTRLRFTGAVIILYLLIIGLILFFLLRLIPSVADTINHLITDLNTRINEGLVWVRAFEPGTGAANLEVLGIKIDLDSVVQPIHDLVISGSLDSVSGSSIPNLSSINIGQVLSSAGSVVGGVLGIVTDLFSTGFLALFLSFLILIELPKYQDQVIHSIPQNYQRETLILGGRIMKVWNGFFRGQLTLVVIIGIITYLQLALMGVSNPVGLSVIVALISLIPTIGGVIALVPLGLVPLLQGSSVFTEMANGTFALFVVGVNLIISQLIWNVIAPKIMGDAVSLPLPVIIIGIVVGTAVGGALGAFLIVPILGSIRVILLYLMSKINQHDPFPGEVAPHMVELSEL